MNTRVKQTGQRQANRRPPVVGSISPGIKKLTTKAAAVQGLQQIYAEGNAAGASYDDIEKMLKQNPKCPAYPLRPSNAPYFRVHQSQFTVPGAAQTIMDEYATKRDGDTEPHLYSFPIVFRQNDIDAVFQERFEAWSGLGILRWSEAGVNASKTKCMKKEEMRPDKNRRRRWGGRANVVDRECDPNDCEFFQADQQVCFHMSSLYFLIPVVPGVGMIELSFKSIYASIGMIDVLEDVQQGLGRINGLYQNQPIFYISKRPEEISVMDWQTGKPTRRKHDIIHLEASGINMMDFMSDGYATPNVALPAPDQSPHTKAVIKDLVTYHKSPLSDKHDTPEMVDKTTGEVVDSPPTDDEIQSTAKPRMSSEVKKLRRQLSAILKKLEWSPPDLEEYLVGNGGSVDDTHDETKLIEIVTYLATLTETKPNDETEGMPF